jgi:hypothetical protein
VSQQSTTNSHTQPHSAPSILRPLRCLLYIPGPGLPLNQHCIVCTVVALDHSRAAPLSAILCCAISCVIRSKTLSTSSQACIPRDPKNITTQSPHIIHQLPHHPPQFEATYQLDNDFVISIAVVSKDSTNASRFWFVIAKIIMNPTIICQMARGKGKTIPIKVNSYYVF